MVLLPSIWGIFYGVCKGNQCGCKPFYLGAGNARCFSVCRSDVYRAHRIFPVYKGADLAWKNNGEMFRDRRVRRTEEEHSISQFQSFCTALAATLGTGNITGVAAALIAGGPGAIFFGMWGICGFLGMMTILCGKSSGGYGIAIKIERGEWVGGAMGVHRAWTWV